jgi:hypothetical protein
MANRSQSEIFIHGVNTLTPSQTSSTVSCLIAFLCIRNLHRNTIDLSQHSCRKKINEKSHEYVSFGEYCQRKRKEKIKNQRYNKLINLLFSEKHNESGFCNHILNLMFCQICLYIKKESVPYVS